MHSLIYKIHVNMLRHIIGCYIIILCYRYVLIQDLEQKYF